MPIAVRDPGDHGRADRDARAQLAFGNGVLCVSPFQPGLHRIEPFVLADLSGNVSLDLDVAAHPVIAAGTTWNFQYWYRDPLAGGAGYNLSTAVAVPFVP